MPWMTSSTERRAAGLGLGVEPFLQVAGGPGARATASPSALSPVKPGVERGSRSASEKPGPTRSTWDHVTGSTALSPRAFAAFLRFFSAFFAALPDSSASGVTCSAGSAPEPATSACGLCRPCRLAGFLLGLLLFFEPLPIAASLQTSAAMGRRARCHARSPPLCPRMRVLLDPRRPARPVEARHGIRTRRPLPFPVGRRWVRSNFVTTLDGSGVGADGRSGTINTPADNRVFALQRGLCDAVLVGPARCAPRVTNGSRHRPSRPPALVVVSGSGRVPRGSARRRGPRGRAARDLRLGR